MPSLFDPTVLNALFLTFLAGLSTVVGALFVLYTPYSKPAILGPALGFSAGVMIYISFAELLPQSITELSLGMPEKEAYSLGTILFFVGVIVTALLDRVIPEREINPHEPPSASELESTRTSHPQKKLLRTGVFIALAIGLHNLPEGLATFVATLSDPVLGAAIAVSVALHNIPEGIAVAVPIYFATKSKKQAVYLGALSGLAEPVGALICYLLIMPFFTDLHLFVGLSFALVSGIMVFISLDELLPSAEKYGKHHSIIYSLIGGMILMAITLVMMR